MDKVKDPVVVDRVFSAIIKPQASWVEQVTSLAFPSDHHEYCLVIPQRDLRYPHEPIPWRRLLSLSL